MGHHASYDETAGSRCGVEAEVASVAARLDDELVVALAGAERVGR